MRRREGREKRSYEDRRRGGDNGREMEDVWLERRNNRAKKGERENVGFVKETRKTAKEIQSALTFTVPGPLPKAVQSSGSWAAKEHGSPNTLSA